MKRNAFLAAGASFAALPRLAAAQNAPLLPLKVAANPNDTFAGAYYAQDQGFFTRAGLTVDLQTIGNSATIVSSVLAGAIDVGCAVPVTLAAAYLRNLPVVLIAGASASSAKIATTKLIVLDGSPLRNAKDFEGKTVGINALGVGLEISFYVWLGANGADRTKVKLVEVPFAEMGAALDRHTIDAAIIIEPSYTVAARQYHIHEVTNMNASIAPEYVSSCWFTTRDFAQSHPEQIRRFVRAIYDAQTWANANHDASAAILTKYAHIDLNLVRSMTRTPYAERLRPADVQPFLDVAYRVGALSAPVQAAAMTYQPPR